MTALPSIKARLALISAAIIVTVLSVAGIALVILFDTYIERRIEQELTSRLLDLSGFLDVNKSGEPVITGFPSDPRYRTPYSGAYWYIREDARVLWRSRSLWDTDIAPPPGADLRVTTADGPDGQTLYLLEKHIAFGEGSAARSFILGTALDKAEVAALSSSFGAGIAAMLGLIGLLLFAGAWTQAKYGLLPLAAIRQQLGALRRGEKDRLEGPFPEEVSELAQDLNTLFAHQRVLITRARERAGSLAHGLKTPMTILYGEVGNLERGLAPHSPQAIRTQLDLIRQRIDRELSRARAHGAPAGLGHHADVTPTAERLVRLMQRMPRGELIEWHCPTEAIRLAMDPDDLGEILGNLLDNARKWAKTRVDIEARVPRDGMVELAVSDDGPGIPDALREDVTARGTASGGSDNPDGTGLGLSIVAELVESYGSKLLIAPRAGGGVNVSFALPGTIGLQGA